MDNKDKSPGFNLYGEDETSSEASTYKPIANNARGDFFTKFLAERSLFSSSENSDESDEDDDEEDDKKSKKRSSQSYFIRSIMPRVVKTDQNRQSNTERQPKTENLFAGDISDNKSGVSAVNQSSSNVSLPNKPMVDGQYDSIHVNEAQENPVDHNVDIPDLSMPPPIGTESFAPVVPNNPSILDSNVFTGSLREPENQFPAQPAGLSNEQNLPDPTVVYKTERSNRGDSEEQDNIREIENIKKETMIELQKLKEQRKMQERLREHQQKQLDAQKTLEEDFLTNQQKEAKILEEQRKKLGITQRQVQAQNDAAERLTRQKINGQELPPVFIATKEPRNVPGPAGEKLRFQSPDAKRVNDQPKPEINYTPKPVVKEAENRGTRTPENVATAPQIVLEKSSNISQMSELLSSRHETLKSNRSRVGGLKPGPELNDYAKQVEERMRNGGEKHFSHAHHTKVNNQGSSSNTGVKYQSSMKIGVILGITLLIFAWISYLLV